MKRTTLVFAPFIFALPVTLSAQSKSGNFNVGTTYFQFTDQSRKEPFDSLGQSQREVFLQAWYPTDREQGAKQPYVKEANRSLGIIKTLFRLDEAFMKKFEALETNAYADAPISDRNRKYPLLIFQHGYSFWLNQNNALMEFLASHGYIVVSIAHHFETCYAIKDERNWAYSLAHPGLQARWGEILNEDISKEYGAIMDNPFTDRTIIAEQKVLTMQPNMQTSVQLWAQDASFVLDELRLLNKKGDSPLAKRIDLKKVGAFGMSFGGAATGQFLNLDKRVKAGLNMDGAMFGDLITKPLNRPFMFMIGGNHGNLNELHYQQSTAEAYRMTIAGSKHLDFCDLNLISPEYFQKAGLMGEIDKPRMNEILRVYTLSFFDRHLKSIKEDFVDQGDYPEVKIQRRNHK